MGKPINPQNIDSPSGTENALNNVFLMMFPYPEKQVKKSHDKPFRII